jgi:hypothetical protein
MVRGLGDPVEHGRRCRFLGLELGFPYEVRPVILVRIDDTGTDFNPSR